MSEAEYKEKLQVREQLSQFDRLRVLEYEFQKLLSILHEKDLILPWTEPDKK